ncbi:hypothetical protein B9Z55_018007 [Caenorhabditis nigoni]|nr:hypothetical protein B9Z55_018007 [Caenorhabditis nigoni]
MHLHGASMFVYADSFLKSYKFISRLLVCVYCASFGLCVSLLATHFFYRYLAICRPSDLCRFDGQNLLKLYILPIIFSTIWFLIAYVPLEPSDVKSEYMRIPIRETYNDETAKLGYIGVLYYYPDESGQMVINYSDFVACFGVCGIMGLFITIIMVCGFLTYRKIESVGKTMSFETKELNNQLFRTLVVQTMVPMLTMFTPVGLLVIFPMFSINVGRFANAPSLNAGIYPALDATIAIFMIRDFRDVVLCRRGRKVTFSANTSAAQYSATADP